MRRFRAQHFSSSLGLFSCAIVFFFLAGLQAVSAGPIYSVQILGSIAGTGSAAAINNSGVAVGFITDASGKQTPVSFNGQTASLPGLGQANGINDAGTMVGATYVNNTWTIAEWSNGQATNVQGLTGLAGSATGINNAGQIVGGYLVAPNQTNAFLWNNKNGTLTNLGTLNGGTSSTATAINAAGQVVGNSFSALGTSSAFFWNGSSMTSLCSSCSKSNWANALNSSGTAVGTFINSSGYMNAAEYSSGAAVDLGTLGGTLSAGYGIDDSGDVVGYSYTANNAASHAFLYSNGVMMDLNNLLSVASGWTITAAYGFNDLGDIVGVGTLNGQTYAVSLDPSQTAAFIAAANLPMSVPEPAPLLLTAGGLLFIGTRFWRRRNRTSA
jgi:probable HAF family extracellular repeat protein